MRRPWLFVCALTVMACSESGGGDARDLSNQDPGPVDTADAFEPDVGEIEVADTIETTDVIDATDATETRDATETLETTDATDTIDTRDATDATDATDGDTPSQGTWDPGDDRVSYIGTCATLGYTCSGGALIDCQCVRDAAGKCLSNEAYRVDCARIYPDAATCASVDDLAMCAVLPGGRCLFSAEELGLPEANPLVTQWITLEHEAAGVVAPCAGELAGCVIEADGVGRCRETLPECTYPPPGTPGNDPALPAAGECNDAGTLEVITCSDEERRADRTTLARVCAPDTCGVTCAGLPDGAPCSLSTTRGTGQFYWYGWDEVQPLCGPFSHCDASATCAPRTCTADGSGACANASDCAALAVGLETAFETLLACIAASSDPADWSTCLRAEIPVSTACAACFTDLQGDFEACSGF